MVRSGIITTARLRLRPMAADDVYDLYEYAATEAFSALGGFRRLTSFRAAQEAVAGYLHYARTGTMVPWTIERRADGRMIGHCLLQYIDERRSMADLLYGLEPKQWGYGYATEAAASALDWAMSYALIRTVSARCQAQNLRSRRVIAKLGMVPAGLGGEPMGTFMISVGSAAIASATRG